VFDFDVKCCQQNVTVIAPQMLLSVECNCHNLLITVVRCPLCLQHCGMMRKWKRKRANFLLQWKYCSFNCLCVVDGKLAPIFEKRTKQQLKPARKSAPVLTEAEKQALEVRRAFLTSGVPEELKRQKPSLFVPVSDTCPFVIWPADNHVQQRPVAAVDTEQCDPWTLLSCDLPYRTFAIENISPSASLRHGLFTDVLDKAACRKAEVCLC